MVHTGVIQPMLAFRYIFFDRCLQDGDRVIFSDVLGIHDFDAFFQKAGRTHILRLHEDAQERTVFTTVNETVETFRRCAHANDERHRAHMMDVRVKSFDEALHDGSRFARFRALCPAMRFVDDDVKPIGFLASRILERFPDGIRPAVAVLNQFARTRQLLRIQKINRPIAEYFLVKRIFLDFHALAQANFPRLERDFVPRLRIERRRVRQPQEDGIGLRLVAAHFEIIFSGFRAIEDAFDERRQDDGLSRAGRRLERHHLIPLRIHSVRAKSVCYALSELFDRLFLKSE